MSDADILLNLTSSLLDSIVDGNWETYTELCDESLTCFEPEALGNLVEGLDFHRFYFDCPKGDSTRAQTTIVSPHVRMMGDVGIVSYLRLTQVQVAGNPPATRYCEETRVWQKKDGQWKHVHFHRSLPTS